MIENDQENFFVSESLKDVLDRDDLIQEYIDRQAETGEETILLGKIVQISLGESSFTVLIENEMVKTLLKNPETTFSFRFMDETWLLSASSLKIDFKPNGSIHATLTITGRR